MLPDGWETVPATSMRTLNFLVGGAAECYAALLKGPAGGVSANINRWRQQMGRPPLSAEEISNLPKIELLGRQASMIEIEGDYTGMMGGANPGYMLIGVVADLTGQTLFIKLVGPKGVVSAHEENFASFCRSLKETATTESAH